MQATLSSAPAPINSSAEDIAIQVQGLSKCYHIYDQPQDRLKQAFWPGAKNFYREFWALKDVSFQVKKGEAFGIVGCNGSGKSTLLQIIAGTLSATQGKVTSNGRIAALLELGSGFNPEFSGKENVFLNGAILGFSQAEMAAKYDEIVAFADIGDFINQPVKTYSSGMYVRLAFAVQACVEPDILIVDEALAVGDIFFRQKCYKRLNELLAKGVSIILVTHALGEVEQFCQNAILLHHGNLVMQGSASEVIKRYYLVEQTQRLDASVTQASPATPEPKLSATINNAMHWPAQNAFIDISKANQVSNDWARCTGIAICNAQGTACHTFQQGENMQVFYEFELLRDIEVPIGGIVIQNEKGIIVHGKHSLQYDIELPNYIAKGNYMRFCQSITLNTAPGEYTFEIGLATISSLEYQQRMRYTHEEFNAKVVRICHLPHAGKFFVNWQQPNKLGQLPFYGLVDLPGFCNATQRTGES